MKQNFKFFILILLAVAFCNACGNKQEKHPKKTDIWQFVDQIFPKEDLEALHSHRYKLIKKESLVIPNIPNNPYQDLYKWDIADDRIKSLQKLGVKSYAALWFRKPNRDNSIYFEIAVLDKVPDINIKKAIMGGYVHAYQHIEPHFYKKISENLYYSDHYSHYFYADGKYMFNLQSEGDQVHELLKIVLNYIKGTSNNYNFY
ncbi:MAG: hypothetical protein GY714_17445 [Desulfobacterales bacterium]|nr:hypothetical protein [Desulfobacterales bacterium]